jgi:prepilin-type N-terminal cleavage/methylation domain-containing protein
VSARRRRSGAHGFTLIEMLVVVLLSGIVLTLAANFTLDLSHASRAALAESVDVRRAAGVIDRVARDLEAATLVKKPAELDPLEHPWLFLAEGRGRDGADRLRFQARNHRPRSTGGGESDLVELAYWLVPAAEGEGSDLMRFASARPPVPPLDRSFPRRDAPGVELLASNVALFAVRLQDADGAWQSAWDSWSPAQSSQLPVAAEIQVALFPTPTAGDEPFAGEEPEHFTRPVVFALDPLDLEKALAGAADEEEKEGEEEDELACVTVRECESRNQAAVNSFIARNPDLRGILDSIADQCWKDHAGSVPVQVTNCE